MNSKIKILILGIVLVSLDGFSQENPDNTYASHISPVKDISPVAVKLSGTEYTVQVGAFIKPANAQKLQQKFSQKGYLAEIFENLLDGKQLYYLVWIGSFSEAGEAEKMVDSISSEFHIKGVLRPRSAWHR